MEAEPRLMAWKPEIHFRKSENPVIPPQHTINLTWTGIIKKQENI